MKIIFDPHDGFTTPDNHIDAWWLNMVDMMEYNPDYVEAVGSETLIQRARVGLAEGDIAELIVTFKEVDYEFTNPGAKPPDGYWHIVESPYGDLTYRIIKTSYN